jgi:hypothetical protein
LSQAVEISNHQFISHIVGYVVSNQFSKYNFVPAAINHGAIYLIVHSVVLRVLSHDQALSEKYMVVPVSISIRDTNSKRSGLSVFVVITTKSPADRLVCAFT